MRVSIIIPNYNGARLLHRYLPSMLAAVANYGSRAEVIVVDDASTDHSLRVLAELFPSVRVVRHTRNRGFQAACNTGAHNAKSPLLLFLNTDMEVAPDLLAPMARHFDDDNVFAVAARSLVTTWGVGSVRKGGPWNESVTEGRFERGWLELSYPGFQPDNDTAELFCECRPILYAVGGALMCRRDRFFSLRGFDALYAPFTVEDLDLCYRAWKRGWTVLYEPRALIHHEHSASIGRTSARRRRRVMARNFYLFHWKNVTDPILIKQHFAWLAVRLLHALFRRQQAYVLGFLLALARLPAALRKRRIEQRDSQRTDHDVIRTVMEH